MKISAQEFDAVTKLQPFDRYQYFIKRVADWQVMYTLKEVDGNFSISKLEENTLISFWSAQEYAEANVSGDWSRCSVESISLTDFEDRLVPTIRSNGWLINVFSVDNKSGFVVTLDEFIRDLNNALEKYI